MVFIAATSSNPALLLPNYFTHFVPSYHPLYLFLKHENVFKTNRIYHHWWNILDIVELVIQVLEIKSQISLSNVIKKEGYFLINEESSIVFHLNTNKISEQVLVDYLLKSCNLIKDCSVKELIESYQDSCYCFYCTQFK